MVLLEEIDCPLCGSHEKSIWANENGYRAVKCECGLVYVTPRPDTASIEKATMLGAHTIEQGELLVAYRRNARAGRQYARDVRSAFSKELLAGRSLRWLDIGAGYGELVEQLQAILPAGSQVYGIEPMKSKAADARKRGLPIDDIMLDQVSGRYDVISLMNVFSHIADFRAFLAQLMTLLEPGGSIFLRTGNGGDLASRQQYPDKLDLPDHLVFAGRGHLEAFLAEQGMAVSWIAQGRLDTPLWALKSVVKRAIGRPAPIVLPYRSPFRDLRLRARALPNPRPGP